MLPARTLAAHGRFAREPAQGGQVRVRQSATSRVVHHDVWVVWAFWAVWEVLGIHAVQTESFDQNW